MIDASQTFNNTISTFYTNVGSYSLIKEIDSDNYYKLNYEINNISLRIKNGELSTEHLKELSDELVEIKIANDNVRYILEENNTPENINYGLELLEVLIQLLDILISYHLENIISSSEYHDKLSKIHTVLIKKEEYFNHHILKDDPIHDEHIKQVIENIDEKSITRMSESEFLGELEKW